MSRLHPDAINAYNARADEVAKSVTPASPRPQRKFEKGGDAYVSGEVTDEHVVPGSTREYISDRVKGHVIECRFDAGERGMVAVAGAAHDNLLALGQRIARERAYRDSLSDEFIYDRLVDWVRERTIAADPSAVLPFVEFLDRAASEAVRPLDMWLPIPGVQITKPIEIGRVTFRRITKPMMDDWMAREVPEPSPRSEAFVHHMRSRLQEATAACITIEAELNLRRRIARKETEAAIAIFRFASPSMLNIREWAPLDPAFVDGFGSTMMLQVDGRTILGYEGSLPENMRAQWLLLPEDIDRCFSEIWAYGHNLIVTRRNPFQELLLGALIHFSKSVLKADLSERLLYVISALEALLVRDTGENIVQNLRERMVIMMGPNVEERLKAAEVITKVYGTRSRFVHAGRPVEEISLLGDFLLDAWSTMYFLLGNYGKWATKEDLLKCLDEHKLKAPMFSTQNLPNAPAG